MLEARLIATIALILCVLFAGLLGRRLVSGLDIGPEQRQRTRSVLRHLLFVAFLVGIFVIWAELINRAALVASGFAVAIVLFNKDLILNLLGWWQKTMSGSYRIGDRIRIGDYRGDVLDYGVMYTRLMEVSTEASHGMRTGNVVTLPNMLLLTEPVVNETLVLGFEWKEYRFSVPVAQRSEAEAILLMAARERLDRYRDRVTESMERMTDRFAFHPIDVEPRVFVEAPNKGKVGLTLRLATPARELRVTQDALNRAFLAWSGDGDS